MNKRGQGLSTNAIVLIILAVVVLVMLIMGFTLGFDKISPFIGSNNVESIVQQCGVACGTSSVYSFCSDERTLKSDDLPGGEKEVVGTCVFFSEDPEYAKYGIRDCSNLCQ